MELRDRNDDKKIIAALVCLFIGFVFIWNIVAHTVDIYELRLDAETCNRVKLLGMESSKDCTITAPFRQGGPGIPIGLLVLPDGSEIQISPVAANRTNRSVEWSAEMKTQLVMAILFWVATLALLLSTLRDKE